MHSRVVSRDAQRSERGAVAIIVALSMTALLVLAALVIDFGLVRVDRQVDKSAADSATLAGLHALDAGDGNTHPFVGVCAAIQYLKQNSDRFDSIDEGDTTGWSDAAGNNKASGCTDTTLRAQTCVPSTDTSWARFTWTGDYQGAPLSVAIQSGYEIPAGVWGEDNLQASLDDADDDAGGCDQLAVIVSQTREPGLGSLATSSDLKTAIRSVGRVQPVAGGAAPAMLILDRTGCEVLSSTSGGGGSGAFVHVLGFYSSSTGLSQGGSIHSDSDASTCSSASHHNIYYGSAANTIVAYAAPTSTGTADDTKPGEITSVAGANGVGLSTVRDDGDNVYSSTQVSGNGTPHLPPLGRGIVTRSPVDDRYMATAKTAMLNAYNNVFVHTAGYFTPANGWKTIGSCTPTAAELNLTASDNVYVQCNTNAGYADTRPIKAGVVVFSGKVAPPNSAGTSVNLPNATKVYVYGRGGIGISFGNNGEFTMHTSNLSATPPTCGSGLTSSKATMFVFNGNINGNGGKLQLCNTTVFMMAGQSDGCVPSTSGTAPTTTPCSGLGNGQIDLHGSASVDWTAPNELDATIDPATGDPLPAALVAWHDVNGPEDLALWDESSSNTSNKYILGGSGTLHSIGVFMVPNAVPFAVGGGGSQNLVNAQYIATTIALNGGAQISMTVDPNAAVTLPRLDVVGLVR